MKNIVSLAVTALVGFVVIACAAPPENAERTAACKEAGNQRMCGVCCKTKASVFTTTGTTGTCVCSGEVDK